ncbi:hypothetical protein CCL11_02720 [Pseudomonas syringae]|nr:hypothetical protein CCL11_02720 [Pseudomonas syringae]
MGDWCMTEASLSFLTPQRPERHADAERRTIVELPTQRFSTKLRLSFLTLQRGNAVRDALRRQEDSNYPDTLNAPAFSGP